LIPSPPHLRAAILAAVAIMCVAPAGARAATLTSEGSCAIADPNAADPDQPVIHGAGFAVGTQVSLTWSGGEYAGAAVADAAGGFTIGGPGWQLVSQRMVARAVNSHSWEHASELIASDGQTTARLPMSWAVRWLEAHGPARPAKRARLRFRVWGLPTGHVVYAHLSRPGHHSHDVRLGTTHGACGDVQARARLRLAWEPWVWNVVVTEQRHTSRTDLERGRFLVTNAVEGPSAKRTRADALP
jgi:hypothetical protein